MGNRQQFKLNDEFAKNAARSPLAEPREYAHLGERQSRLP